MRKLRMKWRNVALPSSSNSNAKLKRQDYESNSKKPRVSSNVMRPGKFLFHALTN